MSRNFVANNLQVLAFPTVNAISDELFLFTVGFDEVVFDKAVFGILQVNAKEIIVEDVVFNANKATVIDFNSARIV